LVRRGALAAAAILACALLLGSPAHAQGQLAESLVGTWEGELQPLGKGTREDPHRTLIIRSVQQKNGKWVGEGRFGITGKGLARVQIEVDASGPRPWIRFVTNVSATVRLELLDEQLVGTFSRRELGGTPGTDRAIKLERRKG